MKSLICSFGAILFLLLGQQLHAQSSTADEDILLKKGYTLTWENNSFGKSFFYIDINKFNMNDDGSPYVIDVNFSMSIRESLKGNIVLKEDALKNSMKMHNYFSPGDIVLEDKTSVWLSKKASQFMKKSKSFEIEVKEGTVVKFDKFSKMKYKIRVESLLEDAEEHSISAIKAMNDKGQYIIMCDSKNDSNPIILSMKLPGLDLALKTMKEKRFSFNNDNPFGPE